MTSLQPGDLARERSAVGIDHQHFRSMREVYPPGRGIEGQIVEIFTATLRGSKRNLLEQVIRRLGETCGANAEQQKTGADREMATFRNSRESRTHRQQGFHLHTPGDHSS